MKRNIIQGSVERYTLTMQPIGDSTLKACSWFVSLSARRQMTIDKSECIAIDDNTYDFIVDTSLLGTGRLDISLHIEIIDANAPDGYRRQIIAYPSEDTIVA